MLLRSASGIGPNPKCSTCHAPLSLGSTWQGNFAGFLILTLVFAVAQSVLQRSYAPYLILPAALLLAVCVVCKFARMQRVVPYPYWKSLRNYILLVVGMGILVHYA